MLVKQINSHLVSNFFVSIVNITIKQLYAAATPKVKTRVRREFKLCKCY